MNTISNTEAAALATEFVGQMSDDDRIAFTIEGWREAVGNMMSANGNEYSADQEGAVLDAVEGIINGELTADLERRIDALRSEAGSAGDREQVAICDRALDGDADAIGECREALRDALAIF